MSRSGSGMSNLANPADAARAASRAALEATGVAKADGAFLFATADHGSASTELLDVAADVLGTDPVGATAQGVLVAGHALEAGPGIAVLAISEAEAEPFLLERISGREAAAGEALTHAVASPIRADDLVVVFPDPYAIAPGPFLESIQEVIDGATLVGAGAVEGAGSPPVQWAEGEVATGAVSGMVVRGAGARVGVTQACQPVTEPLQVTRTDGHWILEIEGRKALEVFRETAREPLADDLRRAASFVLIALPDAQDPVASLQRGDYRVRNVSGFSESGIAVAEPVATGDRLAFVLREAHGAREDLKRMLAGLGGGAADFGLYLNCCARGGGLFDVPGLEAAYLQDALGPLPLAGMMGAYEIGPVCGRAELLTYTGVLAIAGGSAGSRPA